jgi:hypothetical protein
MRSFFRQIVALVVYGTVCCAGCSQPKYELAPVHGTITLDGIPLSSAKVMFAPVEVGDNPNPGKPAFGLVQNDGSFVLTTYSANDGAVVGEHWVTIVKLHQPRQQATPVSTASSAARKFDRVSLPQKATVVADTDNEIDLALISEDVARYGVMLRD